MNRAVSLAAILATVVSLLAVGHASALADSRDLPGNCSLETTETIRVLLLLDQSGSLRRTDPTGQRVAGATAVVRSFASLADTVDRVEIQVAGFGGQFHGSLWTRLTDSSSQLVIEQVESVGSINTETHTDYVYALRGAVEEFPQREPGDCHVLFWFTDGQHDLEANGETRFYFFNGSVDLDVSNVAEAEGLMPALVCGRGGYADQLVSQEIAPQIVLLGGIEGLDPASRNVLRGLAGYPGHDCPGTGDIVDVGDVDRLPFEMACLAQAGFPTGSLVVPVGQTLRLDQDVVESSDVLYSLATRLTVVALGTRGQPPSISSGGTVGTEATTRTQSNMLTVGIRLNGEGFDLIVDNVEAACGFVSGESPTPQVSALTPTLYMGEGGEFEVVVDGPFGRIEGQDIGGILVASSLGSIERTERGWRIVVERLPTAESVQLAISAEAGPLAPRSMTADFTLNEQLDAPRVMNQPQPVVGEGVGPFAFILDVDGRSGGRLCLSTTTGVITNPDGAAITASAEFGQGGCVAVPENARQQITLHVTLGDVGFAHSILELDTISTPAGRPEVSETGHLALDLAVAPRANPVAVLAMVAALIGLMLITMWAILYGISRLVSRIPDPKKHKVRYGEFVAELDVLEQGGASLSLVTSPVDSQLRRPRRTPGSYRAGNLRVKRRVPLAPWKPPYAEYELGSDLIAADYAIGPMRRSLIESRLFRAGSRQTLGPLVAVAISSRQADNLSEGLSHKVTGVIVMDTDLAKGRDPGKVAQQMITESLASITTEFEVSGRFRDDHERATQ